MFRNKWFWIGVFALFAAAAPVTASTMAHNLIAVGGSIASALASAFHGVFHNIH